MNIGRTYMPSAHYEPERKYTGFDYRIGSSFTRNKSTRKIAVVTGRHGRLAGTKNDPRFVVFALDYDTSNGSIYESACNELARYCDDESLMIIGFYTENSAFTGDIRKGGSE